MGEMQQVGLYLNDLNKFDGSAEMLVTELQHHSQLQKAFNAVHISRFLFFFLHFAAHLYVCVCVCVCSNKK